MDIRLDHIGIAVNSLDEGEKFWRLLGLVPESKDEEVADQGVKTRFIPIANQAQEPAMIELLEPTGPDTPIGKFISKRGVGIQQICFQVTDINLLINKLLDSGITMIDEVPKLGSKNCLIAFVHPKSTGGVLVELSQSL
ncbi:MAG TPA: methylmalonyl-CoA epimerase [Candidatus Poseidoniaceae archaeon]|nr:MAG TPA: methylmalonyl-CoA epimerase [Candidatus Poseidoniales archaeon]HII45005.1 methylmalonyl-CoA epimerase [Candidatus Poseidoniaceae archaeon]